MSEIYFIAGDGTLLWLRHDGRGNGNDSAWAGPETVGSGWAQETSINFLPRVFADGDGNIYQVLSDGTLNWYRHDGRGDGSDDFTGPRKQFEGISWTDFNLFAGGEGIIYAIDRDGTLYWFRHDGRGDGSDVWTGPTVAGSGWNEFQGRVFSGGKGIIYGLLPDGTLNWYRHDGRGDGTNVWTGPSTGLIPPVNELAMTDWNVFDSVFACGGGLIYGLYGLNDHQPDMYWFRHDTYGEGTNVWTGPKLGGVPWYPIAPLLVFIGPN